jgi:cobalt-zinc-cadmium efflux system outer membrane protein
MHRIITVLLLAAASVAVAGESRPGVETSSTTTSVVEPVGTLTLRQALALALGGSPELAMFDYDIRIAEAKLLQAGLRPNPETSIESENIGGSGELSGASGAERTLQLGQLIELAGKRRKRVVEARLGRVLAEFDYEVKKREVFLDTHQAFIEVLAGQRAVAVNQEIVELTESVLPDIQRRIEAGKTSTIEETRSNVSVATARIGLEQARREMLAARHRLAAQWGSTKPRFASAVGNLEDAPPIASLDELSSRLADNPRVARFGTELAQRDATLARERAAAVPDVTLHGGVRQFAQSDTGAFVVGASIPIPLFNRNQGNIRAAREQIGKTKAERLAVQATISAELAEAYHAVQAARAQIDLFRNTVLPESEKALQTITEGYNAGRFSYLEFLDVQRSLVTARQQYLQALVSHQQAVARVESLTSGPLHRGHLPPNR